MKELIEKQKDLIKQQSIINDWLEIRLNDLDSYAFYSKAKDNLKRIESEISALEQSQSVIKKEDWNDAQKNPPKDIGRYWCVVREITDSGTSYYQWNCAYNPNDISKWSSIALRMDVIYWKELPPMPSIMM